MIKCIKHVILTVAKKRKKTFKQHFSILFCIIIIASENKNNSFVVHNSFKSFLFHAIKFKILYFHTKTYKLNDIENFSY